MSEITPNDLPPINELDEFTAKIPELQTDTDVLAGTGGPANFQAQALANRTKYLKRVLDAVSLELTGINQAVTAVQQTADTAKQGADASMKKSANGADIVNPATFRTNIGLSNAMFKGEFGWGGKAINVGSGVNLFDYFTRERAAGLYWVNQTGINRPPNFADCVLLWNPIEHADFYGCLMAIGFTTGGAKTACISVQNGVWENSWTTEWNSKNLSPMTTDTIQAINTLKVFIRANASLMIQAATLGGVSFLEGQDNDGSSRWFCGYPDALVNNLVLRNLKGGNAIGLESNGTVNIDSPRVVFSQGKGFVKNASAVPTFATVSDILAYWATEQSMGSVINDEDTAWRSYISVRHRGGNPNAEGGAADNNQWGFVFYDNGMTSTGYDFEIRKQRSDGWLAPVKLYHTANTTIGSGGALIVASPVIKIYSDGSFEANQDAEGVNVERLKEGVYKITGCIGMHSDAAWNGSDGGVKNPQCRNSMDLTWNNYEVHEDGSVTVYTFHRVHPDAMPFAQNRLTLDKEPFDSEKGHTPDMEWPDQTPIDVPKGFYIQVRVNMPEREEIPYVPVVASKVRHSNVYCNSVSPAK
ncbi:hypothetical protein [Pectobacterium carotovorum]|uniref:phage tail fiber protein n=1 Tax=Pectobacterium carotovorum TaxID=554 RepID=UPI0021F3B6F8|nr:hypothetical protein [Pectobacterium carotovorum]